MVLVDTTKCSIVKGKFTGEINTDKADDIDRLLFFKLAIFK